MTSNERMTVGDRLDGKVVLVTGAGAGIGRAIAQDAAAAGAAVVIMGPSDNVTETAALVTDAGGRAVAVRGDVTAYADVAGAVALAVERFGAVDGVVHNATSRYSSVMSTMEGLGGDAWDDHLGVSLRGAFNCARAAMAELVRTKGRLLLMTSPAAMEGSPTLPGYAAAKGAIRGLTKALAVEWGPLGVRVNALSPLAVTPALANAQRENPEMEGRLRAVVPLGHVGDPATDIAPVVTFLLGDRSTYVNGQTIVVDGGRYTTL